MKLILNKNAESIGVINPVAAIIQNLKVIKKHNLVDEIRETEKEIRKNQEKILRRIEVKGFREIFQNQGYENIVPAGEKLTNLIVKRGLNFYNNLIDSYNIVSAKFASGIGMHDADKISGDIRICASEEGGMILPLFKSKYKTIPDRDLIYKSDKEVIAWLGKKDADSDNHKIDENTNSVCVVVLGNKHTSLSHNQSIVNEIFSLIKKTCPNASLEYLTVQHSK